MNKDEAFEYINLITNNMYRVPSYRSTSITLNESVEGEPLEVKIERIVNNKEPIKDGAPLIYTDRKEGVRASTNIRTDRFEIAVEGMDKVAKSYQAKREERAKTKETGSKTPETPEGGATDGGAKPTQGN